MKAKQFGFDPSKVDIKDEDYIFGSSLPMVVIREDGQWETPAYEPQAEKYETWGCTVWGMQNQIEMYFKEVFGFEPNYAEIFNYILADIGEGGANPQDAYESGRLDGLVDNEWLPIPPTFKEFKDKKQITPDLIKKGETWRLKYDFKHEWIKNPTKETIKEALKYSPIAIGVTAWFLEDGLYVDKGQQNTHWCVAYGYEEDSRGIILKVFDSYDHSRKLLHPDHNISVAKRIHIKMRETNEQKNIIVQMFETLLGFNLVEYFPAWIMSFLNPKTPVTPDVPEVKSVRERLHDEAKKWIGKDASPLDKAPEELSCAEGVSNITNNIIPQFPRDVLATSQLKVILDSYDKYFERTLIPKPGCIIVSPRTATTYGHTGFFTEGNNIISNDSKTGTMQVNYTFDSWIKTFKDGRGLRIYIWEPLDVDN